MLTVNLFLRRRLADGLVGPPVAPGVDGGPVGVGGGLPVLPVRLARQRLDRVHRQAALQQVRVRFTAARKIQGDQVSDIDTGCFRCPDSWVGLFKI